eukprot:14324552-Alexandrium_andersonii.AAC.1
MGEHHVARLALQVRDSHCVLAPTIASPVAWLAVGAVQQHARVESCCWSIPAGEVTCAAAGLTRGAATAATMSQVASPTAAAAGCHLQ